jgi:hypothetical protein
MTSKEYPPLLHETVQQLRASGWSEKKIATAAKRKAVRDNGSAIRARHDRRLFG